MKKDSVIVTELQQTFQTLYNEELPTFIASVKSTKNLPPEFLDSLAAAEKNIEKNRVLLAPILPEDTLPGGLAGVGSAVGSVVGGGMAGGGIAGGGMVSIGGGIFGKLAKKKKLNQYSDKKLIAAKESTSLFEETIQRMEQLLNNTEDSNGASRNYERLLPSEKEELLTLAEQMRNLSNELTQELAA